MKQTKNLRKFTMEISTLRNGLKMVRYNLQEVVKKVRVDFSTNILVREVVLMVDIGRAFSAFV